MGESQHSGKVFIAIPFPVWFYAFVLSALCLSVLLQSANMDGALLTSVVNTKHQTLKSVLLFQGQHPFTSLSLKGQQSVWTLETENCIFDVKRKNDNYPQKCDLQVEIVSLCYWYGTNYNLGTSHSSARGQTTFNIRELLVCVHALLPSGLFLNVEKHTKPASHHITSHHTELHRPLALTVQWLGWVKGSRVRHQ